MTIYQSIILGIVQGITEFLPISSSGHLVLIPYIFNWQIPKDQIFVFDVLIQLGTLVAVLIYFRDDLFAITLGFFHSILAKQSKPDPDARLGWLIIIATIPAATVGWATKGLIETSFNSISATAIFLLITAGLLVGAERLGNHSLNLGKITWKDALIIGLFQIMALFPGISRSGGTISGGIIRNLERTAAARFSFLISVPIMLAAGAISTLDLLEISDLKTFLPSLFAGFITSAVVGYLSIHWLLGFLKKYPLNIFAAYVAIVGILVIISLII